MVHDDVYGSILAADALEDLTLSSRELVERGVRWLRKHDATAPVAEVRERVGQGGDGVRAVALSAGLPESIGEAHARMRLTLFLDANGDVDGTECLLRVEDRRKVLRKAARRLPAKARDVRSCLILQPPEADKHDPARLEVVVAMNSNATVEELISRSLRMLDELAGEIAAERP